MPSFNPFNDKFNTIDKFTTVTVSDGEHSFRILCAYMGDVMTVVEGADTASVAQTTSTPIFVMFLPDYSAEAFGADIDYRVTISHWDDAIRNVVDVDVIVNPRNAVACIPFRFEANEYNECIPLNWDIDLESEDWPEPSEIKVREWYYISIKPWVGDIETGRPDIGFIGSQNAFNLLNDFNLSLDITDVAYNTNDELLNYHGILPNRFGDVIKMKIYQHGKFVSIRDLEDEIMSLYNRDDISLEASLYLADDEHMYGSCLVTPVDGSLTGPLLWDALPVSGGQPIRWAGYSTDDRGNMQTEDSIISEWYDSMKLFGWVRFYRMEDDEKVHMMALRTNSIAVTSEMWSYWKSDAREGRKINGSFKMSYFPRTINKTIKQITNISASTDSKAGIVQPVFIRVRDAASIVIHPSVTENICINLDAYKSSVDKFILQIEGSSFNEIGRTANGVIFKVTGNNLKNAISLGTYYILNQDSEMVTSGRYQYEY